MSAVALYCVPCRRNHHLTGVDAEVAIQTLIAELAEAQTHEADPIDGRMTAEIADEFCIENHLRWVRDPEAYYEHIEGLRESRLAAAREARRRDHGGRADGLR